MSNIYDVLIIGGGVGGIKCATICHKKKLKTLLIDSNDILGGQLSVLYPQKTITNVSEYKPIKAYELVNKLIDELHNTDIDILLGTKLKEVYKHDNIFHIILSNNEYINTKNIIIATGPGEFTPNKLNFDNKNISYFVNNIDDYKNKKVVILGGGDSAVD
jgi:thioredoxin reductase (NADPH)